MKIATLRPWVQTAFLGVWLGPFGLRMHSVPGCVFHCYACPWASFACPIGLIGQFAALGLVPVAAVGTLVLVGALIGSLSCGWACPFGFLQDLLAKVPTPKLRIPAWLGLGRYVVLIGLVLLVPYFLGEKHPLFICRLCPAGPLEAALPRGLLLNVSWHRLAILGAVLGVALFTYRPWCSVLCPLGGILALFNRVSLFFLRYHPQACNACDLCRTRCRYGVKVDQSINNTTCVRCLECTTCPAISASLAPRRCRPRDDAGNAPGPTT